MEQRRTDSFVLSLRLEAGAHDRKVLDDRFFKGCLVYNVMAREAEKRINRLYLDKGVKEIRKRMRKKGYELSDEEKDVLLAARTECGLNENAFQAYLKPQAEKYSRWLDGDTVQKLASRVWKAAGSVLAVCGKGNGMQREELDSLEGKSNCTGIMYRKDDAIQDGTTVLAGGRMLWLGLSIPVRIRKNDHYAMEALEHKVRYCRITRAPHADGYRYWLQLVLEGRPPEKRKDEPADSADPI